MTILSSMSSIPINNNGAEGLLAIPIKEMKELWDFYLQNLMFVMSLLHDLPLLLGTWTLKIPKNTAVKIRWGLILYNRVTLSPPFHHLSLTASPLPHRQGKTRPVVVRSLDGRPRWPRSSNFRPHVNSARKPSPAVIQGHLSFGYF